MPTHDWTSVESGILRDFHHAWIEELKRSLNSGVLPGDYYARDRLIPVSPGANS